MTKRETLPADAASNTEIDDFLAKVAAAPATRPEAGTRGRLIFALDATASREPTWDRACHLQGEMFEATAGLGGLAVKLVFFRGFGECKTSPWLESSAELLRLMAKVFCLAGQTQIGKVLGLALTEAEKARVGAVVYVGDAMEENIDQICKLAGDLGLRGVPVFMFHEGGDGPTRTAFEQVARLSGGACCKFSAGSAKQLKDLLGAVAVYAAGGRAALEDFGRNRGDHVRLLLGQLAGGGGGGDGRER
ncbi:VWA domain-containing protein [uncultured Gammaproteobacteria bacterium]